MTNQQINEAVAKCFGWIAAMDGTFHDIPNAGKTPENQNWRTMPDYCNDLNAMHEAEKKLTPNDGVFQWPLWKRYIDTLDDMMGRDDAISATARQRAEAFLKTLNKWSDQ